MTVPRSLLAAIAGGLFLTGCRPNAQWSPDSTRLALEPRGRLFTFDTRTKAFKQLTRGPQRVFSTDWSPGGDRLLYYLATVEDGDVKSLALGITPLATGVPARLKTQVEYTADENQLFNLAPYDLVSNLLAVDWHPDGRRFAYCGSRKGRNFVAVSDVDGAAPRVVSSLDTNAYGPVWSPDGSKLALITSAQDTGIRPLAEGAQPGEPAGPQVEVVNADGTGRTVLWKEGQKPPVAGFGPGPIWSADGSTLLIFTDPAEKKPGETIPDRTHLFRVPVGGGDPAPLGEVSGPSPFITARPDGSGFALFLAPTPENMDYPELAISGTNPASLKRLTIVDETLLGLKKGSKPDVDGFPIPSISPDGKQIALLFVMKEARPALVLTPTDGGKSTTIQVPLAPEAPPRPPATKPPARPAPKKPAPKKPAPKKPARRS